MNKDALMGAPNGCSTFDSSPSHCTLTYTLTRSLSIQHNILPLMIFNVGLFIYLRFDTMLWAPFKHINSDLLLLLLLNPCFRFWTSFISEFVADVLFQKPVCSSASLFWLSRNCFSLIATIHSQNFASIKLGNWSVWLDLFCWFPWLQDWNGYRY